MESIGIKMESEPFAKTMLFTISLDGYSVSKASDVGVIIIADLCNESFVTESTIVRVRSADTSFTGVQDEHVPMMNITETYHAMMNRLSK